MKLLLFALFVAVCLKSAAATTTLHPTHMRATNLPLVHPFKIICHDDLSVTILKNTSYNLDLFVAGNVSTSCPNRKQHFTIEKKNMTLDALCMDTKENAFLIEVQDRTVSTTSASSPKPYVVGGKSSIVYRVTCIPDTDGDPVNVTIVRPVSVKANATELVLPKLKIGIFAASAQTPVPVKSSLLTSVTLGVEVQLVIYNDRSGGKMPYMLIPSQCDAHPAATKTPKLTLLKDDHINNNCSIEDKLLSRFKVTNATTYDLSYATLYPFTFEGFADTPVVLECTVYICPKDNSIDGIRSGYCEKTSLNPGKNRCSQVSATDYTKKRRRRDVGVGDSGVGRATLRATFSVQEPLVAGASRCSTGIWALVALMYVFK